MKKINILVPLIILIVIISNVYYFLNTYHLQIDFQKDFLLKQTQISGYEIEKTGQDFLSDLNFILFSENINRFFSDPVAREEVSRKIEIFYTKYQNLISGITLYDNHQNAFTFYKDGKNKRISNIFITREQKVLAGRDQIRFENGKYVYYLPVFQHNQVTGNIVVALDHIRFISSVFEKSHLGEIQWQWLLDDKGKILFSNLHADSLRILGLKKIAKDVANGYQGSLQHKVVISGKETTVVSAYYPTYFLGRDFGIVFSLQTDIILKTITKNALILASLTLLLIILMIVIFVAFLRLKKDEETTHRQNHENLVRILENIPIGIFVLSKDHRILFINQRARSTFSLAGESLEEGRAIGNWFFEGSRNQIKALMGLHIDMRDVTVIRKDDTEWVLLKEEIPILFRGKEAVLEAIIDVTPLEKARRQEEAANKAKMEMMHTMSKEIRAPLNKIIEKAVHLGKTGEQPDKAFVEELRYSTDLLTSIVEDILEFSKMEAGQMILEEIPFKLRHELKLVFNKHKPVAHKKELRFYTLFEENVPDNYIGDPFKTRQVLSRLIENAIAYTERGEVKILVSRENVDDRRTYLCFEITDTGSGMPPEQLTLLNSKKNSKKETQEQEENNLGLSIVLQLIDLLNGEIHFSSPATFSEEVSAMKGIGPGTTVTVKIPVFLDERFNKEVDTDSVSSYAQIRVLLIKNNDESDKNIREYLNHFGVQTTLNFYMDKTVQLIENNAENPASRYHILIIKDSPSFDGFELLYGLYDRKLTEKYIIIIVSSNDKKGNYARARKLGADYYLIDPVQGSELFNILQDNFPHIEMEKSSNISLEDISRSVNILVAEDNLVNQKMMQGFFKNLGFEIDLAHDGLDAVEKATQREYDLILMDVMMPNMDGWEATRALRKKGVTTPIVAVTADVTDDAEQRSRDSGMNDYITKPVRPKDIKKLLIKWLAKNKNSFDA
jgi:CheY-like chemotaxis protein/PAS domain-containing protein